MEDLRVSQESQETVTRIQSKAEAMYREGTDMQPGESNRLRGSSGISKVLNTTTGKVTTQHNTNVGSDGDPSFKDYHDDRSTRVARVMEQDQATVLESALNDGTQKLSMSEHAQGLQQQRGAVTGVEIKNSLSLKNEELVVGSFDLFQLLKEDQDRMKVKEAWMMPETETPMPARAPTATWQSEMPRHQRGRRAIRLTLKLTDLSEPTNPFVILKDRALSEYGTISIHEAHSPFQPKEIHHLLPWLRHPTDVLRRTLKLEVIFRAQVIMCRYLHLSNLYPIEYPKIAL